MQLSKINKYSFFPEYEFRTWIIFLKHLIIIPAKWKKDVFSSKQYLTDQWQNTRTKLLSVRKEINPAISPKNHEYPRVAFLAGASERIKP